MRWTGRSSAGRLTTCKHRRRSIVVTICPRRLSRPLTTGGASGTRVSSDPLVTSCTTSTLMPTIRSPTKQETYFCLSPTSDLSSGNRVLPHRVGQNVGAEGIEVQDLGDSSINDDGSRNAPASRRTNVDETLLDGVDDAIHDDTHLPAIFRIHQHLERLRAGGQ